MIKGFRHKGLALFTTGSKKGMQPKHADKLSARLAVLNEANGPDAMRLPGYELHELKGDLEGHWAVKVDGNWRLTFVFEKEDAVLVDYQDDH